MEHHDRIAVVRQHLSDALFVLASLMPDDDPQRRPTYAEAATLIRNAMDALDPMTGTRPPGTSRVPAGAGRLN